ncbi:unnamed protein product [Cunninghamella echinulata]
MFYPSQNDSSYNPTILWLAGGPGCSSIMPSLAWIGPCRVNLEGNNTTPSSYHWNKHANLLFLDQPIGTGFSFGLSKVSQSSEAVKQVYAFLQAFFKTLPQYTPSTSFIIAGESYAGHYLPALSSEIIQQNKNLDRNKDIYLPYTTMIIGNGWTDPKKQLEYNHIYACDHDNQFKPLFDQDTCQKMKKQSTKCQSLMNKCYQYKNKWTCIPAGLYCQYTQLAPFDKTNLNPMDIRKSCVDEEYCYDMERSLEIYANNEEIQSKLGVDDQAKPYMNCKSSIERRFLFSFDPVIDYSHLVSEALYNDIHVLLIAGDMDWLSQWYGIKAWAMELEWDGKRGFNSVADEIWLTAGKPTGEVRRFNKFTFFRVFDAGHMAAFDQPEIVLTFLQKIGF